MHAVPIIKNPVPHNNKHLMLILTYGLLRMADLAYSLLK